MYIVLQCGFKCNCILDNFCDSVAHPYSANKNKKNAGQHMKQGGQKGQKLAQQPYFAVSSLNYQW